MLYWEFDFKIVIELSERRELYEVTATSLRVYLPEHEHHVSVC